MTALACKVFNSARAKQHLLVPNLFVTVAKSSLEM